MLSENLKILEKIGGNREKAKKERLIGAIILVLLLVSIVPIILNGNFKEAPKRNDSLELPDQIKKERRIETIDLKNKKNQTI